MLQDGCTQHPLDRRDPLSTAAQSNGSFTTGAAFLSSLRVSSSNAPLAGLSLNPSVVHVRAMDFSTFVNPADLTFDGSAQQPFAAVNSTKFEAFDFAAPAEEELVHKHKDSAVDLTKLHQFQQEPDYPSTRAKRVKIEPTTFDAFLDNYSSESNTPSPAADFDFVYSTANSPGEFVREESRTSSPEVSNDMSAYTPATGSSAYGYQSPEAICIPQQDENLTLKVSMDRTKTRAETQTKVTMVLDGLPESYEWARFARQTISKPKQLATTDEIRENYKKGAAVSIDFTLVCAVAVEEQKDLELALARARGEGSFPTRTPRIEVSEMEKDDPAHPQNGGAVIICNGCQERERKRFGRKKKRNEEEEEEWSTYDDKRIIIVNEKEFKRLADADAADSKWGAGAKKVEFSMRIACYCRHQESKTPVGYRVIFTIRGTNGELLTQTLSEILQVTDDHKNKETSQPELLSPTLSLPSSMPPQTQQQFQQYPLYSQYPMNTQFNFTAPASAPYGYNHPPTVFGMESQPPTPMYSRPPSPGIHSQPTTPTMKAFNFGNYPPFSHAVAPQQLTQNLNRVVNPQQTLQTLRHPVTAQQSHALPSYTIAPQQSSQSMNFGIPSQQPPQLNTQFSPQEASAGFYEFGNWQA